MNDETIDVDYTKDEPLDKHINGKPLYLTTSQVSQILDETDSTLRFWCTKFKDILHIETSGTHRKFKEEDIEKLKYIKNLLRNEKYSIAQVSQYCSETDTSVMKKKVNEEDPIALTALASAMAIEIGSQLEEYKLQIKSELIAEIKQQFYEQNELQNQRQEETKEHITKTIENEIKDKFETQMDNIKSAIDNMEQTTIKNITEKEDALKQKMEERKLVQAESQKKKTLWSRITGK